MRMKNVWILAAAVVLVLGAAGYTIARSTGEAQGGIIGPGMGMMGGGQGGMMTAPGMMNMMMGQPLTQDQLEQFAKQHGITVEQAKQMTDRCSQMMAGTTPPETPKQ